VGYLTDQVKYGYLSAEQNLNIEAWHIYDIDRDKVAYTSSGFDHVIEDDATEEFVYRLDFSAVRRLGNYYLSVDGVGRSHDFLISSTTYNDVFRKVMKGFYYQRSGVALTSEYASTWSRPSEYETDAFIYKGFDGSEILHGDHVNTAGGWRDAGDPNKKVVPASVSVHQLMMLYEHFGDKPSRASWNIPDDKDFGDVSDLLIEIKVCIDWLLKMQREDGAVWHAVTQAEFFLSGLGHEDTNPRYLMPVSTTATANFAAALAQASRIFEDLDPLYATQCLDMAVKAWNALDDESIWENPTINGANGAKQYPEIEGYSIDPPGINMTANYEDTEDADERYWAAVELFLATEESIFYDYVEMHLETNIFYPSLWPEVADMASFSYAMGMKDTDDPLYEQVRTAISAYADAYIARSDTTGFGLAMSSADYFWGSNNVVGQFAYTMILAHEITERQEYLVLAQNHLNYILGSNSLNQTFISDIGDQPVEAIFHLPSQHDGIEQVVPGLIPGGPNQFLVPTDLVHSALLINEDPPPAKCYIDSKYSFASNETTILESAGWAFVIGYFYNDATECTTGNLTNTWMGPDGGDWHASTSHWSRLEIPTACHHVIIPKDKTIEVTAGATATCLTIEVSIGATLDFSNASIFLSVPE